MSTTTTHTTEQAAAAPPTQAGEQAKAIVKIEGQDVPIAERIAADDNLLKKALRRFYHSITNATITRKREGGVLIVTVVKRADYKGRGTPRGAARARTPEERVLDAIKRAREHTNPALVLARDLQLQLARGRTTHTALARRDAEIEAAIDAGAKEVESTRAALRRIKECRPVATADTPEGF
jgi:hypothetical protein